MSEPAAIAARRPPAAEPPSALPLPAERLLQDWKQAHERAVAYLAALGVPAAGRDALARRAVEQAVEQPEWPAGATAMSETLARLRDLVALSREGEARGEGDEEDPDPFDRPHPSPLPRGRGSVETVAQQAQLDPFLVWRLTRLAGLPHPDAGALKLCAGRMWSMPRITRRRMVPEWIERRFLHRMLGRLRRRAPRRPGANELYQDLRAKRRRLPWIGEARRRRLLLMFLVLIPSLVASGFMLSVLPHQGRTWLEIAIVIFFGALFGWISIGFWTALFGFFTLVRRRRSYAVTNLVPVEPDFTPTGRTAIVMPVRDEPVDRVFAGLRAIRRSLERAGALPHFDFFILSDSSTPTSLVQEEEAWAAWCREVGGFNSIFYRRRRVHVRRKSGNVADFCRRWGTQYRYMVMLDADSIMAGETVLRLVHLMEKKPDAGMIQTAPTAVNRRSLFARVQQFSSRVYGPMFAAGLHFWQLGDGQYWGHNAIIRIAPFMDHCALPKLPGAPPLGGEILSHDFVEAALMGRAGWTLWLAYDLPGSYEEVPSTLLEEMKRDRRWCQGNLQHLRLLFSEGLFGAHRALFVNGVMSYMSALLWFAFLGLSTAAAIIDVLREPDYFPHGPSLFPEWPIWRPHWAIALLGVTALILFLPKLLSIVLIVFRSRDSRAYGGAARLTLGVLLEILLSSLLAPIRMVFHSRFVVQNLLGRTVSWGAQDRADGQTGWREALRHHGFDTLFASAWGTTLYLLNPDYFWWVTPIVGALLLSIPTSVLASRISLGALTRKWGLFMIPEESDPPAELRDVREHVAAVGEQRAATVPPVERDGLVRVAVDPYANALHRALLGRPRCLAPGIAAARQALLERALSDGPATLSAREADTLLVDPRLVDALHSRVWALADRARAARWGRPAAGG